MGEPPNKGLTGESHTDARVARIDELIRDLVGGDDTPRGLLREHLEGARFYLLGGIPAEYQFNLKLSESLLGDLDDQDLEGRIRAFLRSERSDSVNASGQRTDA